MGALVCTVELNKQTGVKVTIENAGDGITQTIAMDGTKITITVDGGQSGTSTITQDSESVSIACKRFQVTADETIQMTSTGASTYKSGDSFTAESTKEMTLKSTADVAISGQNVSGKGQVSAKLDGGQSNLTLGASGASMSSPQKASVEGQMQVSVSGTMVDVKASGILNVEASGATTVKGAIVNVQGSLVKLG